MTRWERVRTWLNWVNLTSVAGLVVALAGRARLTAAPRGMIIAGEYRLPVPTAVCFTMGNLVLCRHPATWLLADSRTRLLAHEERHVSQYAICGPLFWPLYALASGWSWLICGGYAAHNPFERHAGLTAGGYTDIPVRAWLARLIEPLRWRRPR